MAWPLGKLKVSRPASAGRTRWKSCLRSTFRPSSASATATSCRAPRGSARQNRQSATAATTATTAGNSPNALAARRTAAAAGGAPCSATLAHARSNGTARPEATAAAVPAKSTSASRPPATSATSRAGRVERTGRRIILQEHSPGSGDRCALRLEPLELVRPDALLAAFDRVHQREQFFVEGGREPALARRGDHAAVEIVGLARRAAGEQPVQHAPALPRPGTPGEEDEPAAQRPQQHGLRRAAAAVREPGRIEARDALQ